MKQSAVDRNGKLIVVGAPCLFRKTSRHKRWTAGTVRRVWSDGEVNVDDGDPAIPDLIRNGFTLAVRTKSANVEITEQSGAAKKHAAWRAVVRGRCPTCRGIDDACPQCGWLRSLP